MAIYDPFDVVVVPFPFTDKAKQKPRPALVISSRGFNTAHDNIILLMITAAGELSTQSLLAVSFVGKKGARTQKDDGHARQDARRLHGSQSVFEKLQGEKYPQKELPTTLWLALIGNCET